MLNGGKHKSTYFQSKAGASIKYVYSVCDIRRVAYSTKNTAKSWIDSTFWRCWPIIWRLIDSPAVAYFPFLAPLKGGHIDSWLYLRLHVPIFHLSFWYQNQLLRTLLQMYVCLNAWKFAGSMSHSSNTFLNLFCIMRGSINVWLVLVKKYPEDVVLYFEMMSTKLVGNGIVRIEQLLFGVVSKRTTIRTLTHN